MRSSGNVGVMRPSLNPTWKTTESILMESEAVLNEGSLQWIWREFLSTNLSSKKIGVLVVELVLLYVQCKSSRLLIV